MQRPSPAAHHPLTSLFLLVLCLRLASCGCLWGLLPSPGPLPPRAWERVGWAFGSRAACCSLDLWTACPLECPEPSGWALFLPWTATWALKLFRVACEPGLFQLGVMAWRTGPVISFVPVFTGFPWPTVTSLWAILASPTRAKIPLFGRQMG